MRGNGHKRGKNKRKPKNSVEEKTVNLTLDENGNILNERNLPKILVVDDEEINLRIMKAYLMERDYEILCAKRGAEAVELASKENIDAMVCDIKMPDMDGMQVLKWSSQNRPLMPVVMLTGFVDLATAIAVMREGARNYLTKPIEAKALLDAVDSALAYRRNALQTLARQQDALGYQQELERKIEDSGLKSQKMALDVVVALTNVVKTRSRRLSDHCRRVTRFASLLAREITLDGETSRALQLASSLHDIGCVALNDDIVGRMQYFSEHEFSLYKNHCELSVSILEPVSSFRAILPGIRSHHERFDGKGFPDGLSGTQIPLIGRIIALCDYFDLLTHKDVNDDPLSYAEAAKTIEEKKGAMFDPYLVDRFLIIIERIGGR